MWNGGNVHKDYWHNDKWGLIMTVRDLYMIIDNVYYAIIEDETSCLYMGNLTNIPECRMEDVINKASIKKLSNGILVLHILVDWAVRKENKNGT